jgi:glycine/D-amino acid oxidase-like deaminating enzyme
VTPPWPRRAPNAAERGAYADATVRSYWLDSLRAREPEPRLEGRVEADLCIVGGGYTGLWAALHAVREDPERRVVVLESGRCGEGASGRNGGFLDASLTHGLTNGLARFPEEMHTLERLGQENFHGLAADLERLSIDAELETPGYLEVAMEAHELSGLEAEVALAAEYGGEATVLSAEEVQAQVHSPLYLGAVRFRGGSALVHPGRLADGLRHAAVAAGVTVYEHSPVLGVSAAGAGVRVTAAAGGSVVCARVLMGTSAYPAVSGVGAIGRYIAPVYDYALMTEPLGTDRLAQIGWEGRQGIGDGGNQFHYYRLSRDGRILFGGYDAVYRAGGPVADRLDDHDASFGRLSQNFFTVFPQLAGVRFTHRWGGAIDTCSRFSVCFGSAMDGRVVWAAGYTGLGVGATRWGAQVALDLLDGRDTEATRLRFVRTRPLPFPPEPLRSAVIQLTRNRLAAADRREGRRGLWLGTLDRLGLGFDS